ncbi:hypothetical protein WJX81_002625 [Elliptochloris bilobata]|uniref:Methyltransferase small domain-containing protein n=1 Tax=Elliptochloris bilobata TaxID=381761 RepID=A0AAW1S4A7_9CHLO
MTGVKGARDAQSASQRQWDALSKKDLAQIGLTSYNSSVYEPADDTFALADALLCALRAWQGPPPRLCVEVGCGSGYVACSIALLLRAAGCPAHCIAVDVSEPAVDATRSTLAAHSVTSVDVLCSDLVAPLSPRLRGCVDLLVFNPPYVLTPDSEVTQSGIAAAWAGGPRGRTVIDRLLPHVSELLSANGKFFLVTIADNDPQDLLRGLPAHGLAGREVLRRSADEEALHILQCWRQ